MGARVEDDGLASLRCDPTARSVRPVRSLVAASQRRLRRSIDARASEWRLAVGLRLARPGPIAAAWATRTEPLEVPGLAVRPGARRVLVLPKVGGTEDVVATLAGRGDLGLAPVTLPRGEVKRVFRRFLPAEGPGALGDLDYVRDDPAIVAAKQAYRELMTAVMLRYVRRTGVALVVTANVAYYAERELAAACEAIGLPFVALHKESIRTAAQRDAFTRAYRERIGPFGGRAVAVYNADEQASQVAGGIVPPSRIRVVGCPRIDELHDLRRSRTGPPPDGPVVLLAIDAAAGTWTPVPPATPAPRWERLAEMTEAAFLAAAEAAPQRRFVIKVKLGRERAVADRLPAGLPPNVEVVTGGTATALVREASVLVAFNTTVMLEGIAAGVPVVVPAFAEAAAPDARPWRFELGSAVTEVGHPDELAPTVLRLASAARTATPPPTGDGLTGVARAALDRYVGNADGRAGDRALAFLGAQLDLAPAPPRAGPRAAASVPSNDDRDGAAGTAAREGGGTATPSDGTARVREAGASDA